MNELSFKSPLVVGYKGEIGSFILQGLLRIMPKALNVWCFDINETEKEKIDRIRKSDVIFLCVPIQETIPWLIKYKKYLKGKTIIEQCSLKSWIDSDLELVKLVIRDFNLLSMHILFRPGVTPDKEDRRVALIENYNWTNYIMNILRITDSHLVMFKNYSTHDATMACQQALMHRILLVADNLLDGLEGKTYISGKVRELAKRIRAGDPTLYSLIQDNKYLPKVLKEFGTKIWSFDINKEIK